MKKRVLIALVMVLAIAVSASVVWATSVGLVSYWPFDEGSGATAYDAANGNDGTIYGATYITDKAPVVGNDYALAFDGDDHVQVGDSTALEPANVTVAAWVKASTSPGSSRYIVSKGAHTCWAASYALYTRGGGLYFYVFNPTDGYRLSPGAGTGIWDGVWHHVAGTYDGSFLRLYVDGFEIGTGNATSIPIGYGLPTTDDLFVGAYGGTCNLPFNGLIDEVGVWDRALSAEEIAALSVGVGSLGWLPPIVLDDWTLNENATLPIKFQLYGAYGNLLCDDLMPTLQVNGETLDLRFDSTGCYYIANFRPDKPETGLTATVYVNGVEVGVSRPFDIVDAGTPNGRGRSK